jgi:hypothetical protein
MNTGKSKEYTETFKEPHFPEVKFEHAWTVWEQFEGLPWDGSLFKVACFEDPVGFWGVWGSIPHSDPANFFVKKID